MDIAIIEPYYGGSHQYWADNLKSRLPYQVDLITMPARHWKWRMQGSAYHMAEQINASDKTYDILLVSGMIDLALFKSLLINSAAQILLYMHENQLCYPVSELDKQSNLDLTYGYLNYKSCLVADKVIFNSAYHQEVFLQACLNLLKRMPDYKLIESVESIQAKSVVIPIGILTDRIVADNDMHILKSEYPVLLWNHRWDFDKKPEQFYLLLKHLSRKSLKFNVIMTNTSQVSNDTLDKIRREFPEHILFDGYVESYEQYLTLLNSSDILPVSRGHDFFGISVLEAVLHGVHPVLPDDSVYEEHFDLDLHPGLYYNYQEQYLMMVEHLIRHYPFNAPKTELANAVKNYNWQNNILQYEKLFNRLMD